MGLKEQEIVNLPHKIRFRKKDAKMSGIQGKDIMKPHAISDVLDNHPKWVIVVSGQTTTTDTPAKSTENTSGKSTKETSEQLMLLPYQNTTSSVRDFLARVSQLLESGEGLKTLEAHSSLRYTESLGLRDLAIFSLKMSGDSYHTTWGKHLKSSSQAFLNLGMTANGRCLTARITESHRTGSGCSLSDILEDNPDQKYFLSERQTQHIKNQMDKSSTPLTAIITRDGLTTGKEQ